MKNALKCIAAAAVCSAALAAYSTELPRRYVGAAGALVLPQGGATTRRVGGAVARAGYYFTDAVAVEGEIGILEEKRTFAARGIWHMQGWEWFGKLFGYERFDPFLSLGARTWTPRGQTGPSCGAGALYYLGDTWALRLDAEFTLGVHSPAETAHSISAGLQYSF